MSDEPNENSKFKIQNSKLRNDYKQTDVGVIPEDWKVDAHLEKMGFFYKTDEKHRIGQDSNA